MQQPAPLHSAPAMPAHALMGLASYPGVVIPAGLDAAELDLGYEGAFPFLTDADRSDAG